MGKEDVGSNLSSPITIQTFKFFESLFGNDLFGGI
jgi:hypothetical protein